LRECRQEWRHGKPEARSTKAAPEFQMAFGSAIEDGSAVL
jgi:hypothetical protein